MKSKRKLKHQAYLESPEWAKVRCDLFITRGEKCEICGHAKNLQVHHFHYDNLGHEEPDDLIILCAYHHMLEHGLIKKRKN